MAATYEWHEPKREKNIEKHGFDFLDGSDVFDNPHLDGPAKTTGQEARRIAIGRIGGVVVAIIYTLRGDIIRLISIRKARHGERKRYDAAFGHGDEGAEG